MIKLKHSMPLALLSLAGASSLTCTGPKYDFALHGYIHSRILANSDGNRADSADPMPDGEWRLGNEEDTKIELIPTVTLTADSGVVAKVQANLIHQLKCASDWNCQDDDGHDVQFREGFTELSSLDLVPGMTFWAGKRYSSSNTSNHQFDQEYIQYNGTGSGFDNMNLGFARFDAGVYVFSPTDETKAYPVDKGDQGYPDDYSLNLWLKKIVGTDFDLEPIGHHMNCNENHPISVEKGYGVTGIYNSDGFYGLTGGYSRLALQYGKGPAVGDSLGKSDWGWANLENTQSRRVVLDSVASMGDLEISTFAFWQKDKNYRWQTEDGHGWERSMRVANIRPYHQIARNFAMQYELGYEYLDDKNYKGASGKGKGDLIRITVAPTLTFDSGFWARLQLCFFVTYVKWDKGVSDALDGNYNWDIDTITAGGYSRSSSIDTVNFGAQAKVWS